jgi:hypothetical protein
VQSAAVRYIDGDVDRAKRVLDATAAIRAFVVVDGSITVLEIAEFAKTKVPVEELTPQEVLLADALIDLVVAEVAGKLPEGSVLDQITADVIMHYIDQVDVAAKLTLEG